MTTLLLVRHGRSTSNTAGTLAGRTPGIRLDETGEQQAMRLGERLRGLVPSAVVCSPVERCRQTVDLALASAGIEVPVQVDERFTECDYGSWSNRLLTELAAEPLWRQVQAEPSSVTFPRGEAMQAMHDRVVEGLHDWASRCAAGEGDAAAGPVVVVSHGDPIKAMLAHCLGQRLDDFQRLVVDPASVSIVQLPNAPAAGDGPAPHPMVVATNTTDGQLVRRLGGGAAPQLGGGTGSQQD